MKIKVIDKPYHEVVKMPPMTYRKPSKQHGFWRWILKQLSKAELREVSFTCDATVLKEIPRNQPCLILMNHSCFLDLEIAGTLLADRQYHIICTDDGFVGKDWLMRQLGCIPTKKFITDPSLVRAMKYCVDTLRSSILMYPEASYSFDGTETPLPESLGKLCRLLKVPVVMIRTTGAFLRDPLYNGLQKRHIAVSAKVSSLLTAEEAKTMPANEINLILRNAFHFDHFREQVENGIKISEPFRADGLQRVLYKCPNCNKEHTTSGNGIFLTCNACGARFELEETGTLRCLTGNTRFPYVSDWYAWERECVHTELVNGTYQLNTPVDILMLKDTHAVYRVGSGTLTHSCQGFHLTGCNGSLDFTLSPTESYSLYSDYYWYELGDMICIGDNTARYYCFPTPDSCVDVAKARLAAEELYQLTIKQK